MERRAFFSLALGQLIAERVDSHGNRLPYPDLSEGDRLLIDTVQMLGAVSSSTDKFSLVQQYMAQRQAVTTYLEKAYPGQTVDWSQIPAPLKPK
jgi:hypothetical protein